MRLARTLTTLPLVFVMYFNISGGAFTTEGLVAAVAPGIALLILAVLPVLWSLPETLIVGELASMLPVEGGYYRWVERAFGSFWAFQNGWLTWLYSLVDMAIYPVLFNAYLAFFFPDLSALARWGISLIVIWGSTAINLRGALPVGRVSVASGVFVLSGFLALALAALRNVDHVPWKPFTHPGETPLGALGIGASIALWNYIGWDNASTVEGEIVDAGRTYPRALAFTLPLVVLGYFVPLLAALGASDWTTWREGGWPEIALASAGTLGAPIAVWLAIGGMVSALALFNALLLAYSRIPLVVASDGFLPAAFARTDAKGTPRNAILLSAALYSFFALVPFAGLVVADVLLYALALFLEFGALIALRKREPALRGSFRIPVGTTGVILLAAVPAVVLVVVVGLELHHAEYGAPAVLGAIVAAGMGPLAYLLATKYRARG